MADVRCCDISETIALLLEYLAPEAPTEEETSNMRRAAAYIRSLGPGAFRALVNGAIKAAMEGRLPHVPHIPLGL